MHYVYFIQQVTRRDNPPIKIGLSKNPDERLRHLQTGNPLELKLCMSLPYETEKEALLMERCLHRVGGKRFRRLKGEWFIIYGSWKKLIAQATKMGAGIIRTNKDKYTGISWD